jgi:hypothetical protein
VLKNNVRARAVHRIGISQGRVHALEAVSYGAIAVVWRAPTGPAARPAG